MDETITGVVVGYDGSADAVAALEWAAQDAERRSVPLTICHVWYLPYAGGAPLAVDLGQDFGELATQIVTEGEARARRAAPGVRAKGSLDYGSPAGTLLRAAGTSSLLVVGAREHTAMGAQVLGSVSSHLVAHGHGPVVAVKGPTEVPPEYEPGAVVVGIDGSEAAERALGFAYQEAFLCKLPLRVLCALRPGVFDAALPPYVTSADLRELTEDRAGRALAPWRERYPGVAETTEVQEGQPIEQLLTAADTARLLVVGSRGLGGLRGRMLGSVSQAVLHQARCPVAVVR